VTPWLLVMFAIAGACVAAGLLMVQREVSRPAGALLAGAGVVGLFSTWLLVDRASRSDAAAGLILAGLVLFPAALWAYPRPLWRRPVDFVLGVLLVAPGVAAVLRPHDLGVVASMAALASVVLVAQTWWRLESADGPDRRALLWSSLALGCSVLFCLVLTFLVRDPDGWVLAVALAPLATVPVAMAIGVLRPEIVEVRGLVVQAVVFLVLAVGYIAAFVGVVSMMELLGAAELSRAALAVVGLLGALALHPAEMVLRGVIDQLLFGDRPDPLDAATRVVGRLSDDPATALQRIREDLAVPYVALRRDGRTVASSGVQSPHTRSLRTATSDGGEVELIVGLRPGDLRLSEGDAHVLQLVAPLLVQILRAEQLAADLAAARGQAIATIAEERRRLRRDLHDGLGPALTGIAFSIDAARNTIPSDPDAAQQILVRTRQDTADAIAQIRGLVYGMRPPALDELGLGPALRQQAAGLRRGDGDLLPVAFVIDDVPADLPAAVEVAAYRIVMEALTNIARHAPRASASVRIGVPDPAMLQIEITDDAGPRTAWTPGVGIASMRERAAEVGGTLTAGPTPAGGIVRARLPLTAGPSRASAPETAFH
jgi:signal transduction histidine kinase